MKTAYSIAFFGERALLTIFQRIGQQVRFSPSELISYSGRVVWSRISGKTVRTFLR